MKRAVCSCGYVSEDPDTLELWNGYGDHWTEDPLEDPKRHAVSVWTLDDDSIVIADSRSAKHPNDHSDWSYA